MSDVKVIREKFRHQFDTEAPVTLEFVHKSKVTLTAGGNSVESILEITCTKKTKENDKVIEQKATWLYPATDSKYFGDPLLALLAQIKEFKRTDAREKSPAEITIDICQDLVAGYRVEKSGEPYQFLSIKDLSTGNTLEAHFRTDNGLEDVRNAIYRALGS